MPAKINLLVDFIKPVHATPFNKTVPAGNSQYVNGQEPVSLYTIHNETKIERADVTASPLGLDLGLGFILLQA